jgi:hypothetical protein
MSYAVIGHLPRNLALFGNLTFGRPAPRKLGLFGKTATGPVAAERASVQGASGMNR